MIHTSEKVYLFTWKVVFTDGMLNGKENAEIKSAGIFLFTW
jgi:hypothetical protein